MQNAITILSLIVAIISGIIGILWSTRYKESKQAELDAKDAAIRAKEAELKSMLISKDEQIHLLELGSSPVIVERYRLTTKTLKEINYELITEVDDLKNANEILLKQVREAISSNQRFSESIPVLTVPEDVRSSLSAFVNGSEKNIIDIGQSVYNILIVGENIKRIAGKISKVTALEIDTSPTETVTGSDISNIEIADPESD
ncbi:MAG: hypothetical protein MUO57_14945 [Anaerolineales bacterium]|nr:hypothetical protein [Anaerolineales bacterium]